VKDNSSGKSLIHPSMQSRAQTSVQSQVHLVVNRTNAEKIHKVADDFDLNAKFSNLNEGEDDAKEKTQTHIHSSEARHNQSIGLHKQFQLTIISAT
jgi:hypothetical protein